MGALAQNQTSNCTNPVLDIFTQVNGVATDVNTLEFQIFDLTGGEPGVQIFPAIAGNRQTVNVGIVCPAATAGKITTGRFVAEYTVPVTANIGTHRIKWFFKLTAASNEQSFCEDFEVLPEATAGGSTGYTTIAALRAEGVTTTQADDAKLLKLITRASRYIDKVTGRFFEPRSGTYTLDGSGNMQLFLGDPIISISKIRVGHTADLNGVADVDLADVAIYNRHLTQNLLNPDDRDNPRINLITGNIDTPSIIGGFSNYPDAFKNVEVTGVFGYTDYDGSSSTQGKTPDLIEYVTQKIVIRYLPKLSDTDEVSDALLSGRIKKLRTRDQEIQYAVGSGEGGAPAGLWTGDPEIDHILAGFMRPADIDATQLTVR